MRKYFLFEKLFLYLKKNSSGLGQDLSRTPPDHFRLHSGEGPHIPTSMMLDSHLARRIQMDIRGENNQEMEQNGQRIKVGLKTNWHLLSKEEHYHLIRWVI